jgi:hypothetical protein
MLVPPELPELPEVLDPLVPEPVGLPEQVTRTARAQSHGKSEEYLKWIPPLVRFS